MCNTVAQAPRLRSFIWNQPFDCRKQPETVERLAATGSDPAGSTPEELAAKIKRELDYFGGVIKAANIRIE